MPKSSNLLVLQGLRISLPVLKSCAHDLLEQAFRDEYTNKCITDEEFTDNLIISTFPKLTINDTQGNLSIGERFEMILKLLNKGDTDCKNVSITVSTYMIYYLSLNNIFAAKNNCICEEHLH